MGNGINLLTVVETFGKEVTIVIVLILWFILIVLSLFLKKKAPDDLSSDAFDYDVSHRGGLFRVLLLIYKYSFFLAHIFLVIAICCGIADLYLSSAVIASLTVLFIFLSLAVFLVYLGMFLLCIWKKWLVA